MRNRIVLTLRPESSCSLLIDDGVKVVWSKKNDPTLRPQNQGTDDTVASDFSPTTRKTIDLTLLSVQFEF